MCARCVSIWANSSTSRYPLNGTEFLKKKFNALPLRFSRELEKIEWTDQGVMPAVSLKRRKRGIEFLFRKICGVQWMTAC
mmetsp:Transcript_40943/g.67174  ORF Transcript_40943/g.67174 Transcript_40943/m.67174 type:complete len:80 (-) Transcript_40943:144-383(-)